MAKVSTRVTWILTGNNMQVHGDLIRRILPIDLDAKMERPEDRIFERDAVAQVLAHRRDYLTAGLMILRHYAQDGYPDQA